MHFLLLVLLLCLNPVYGCPMLDDAYGNITEDQIVQEGSPYKITCYLFPNYVEKHNITSDQLTLVSKRKTLKPTIIDKYSIEYAVESASVNDSGFYQCLVPKPGYQRPQLVCATTVTVGYPPGNVTDFSCISYDYSELNCSWTVPDNPVRTSYKLFDYLQGIEVFSRECLKGYPSKDFQTSCVYELNTKPPYLQGPKILNFIVYGNNSLGLSKQRFRINHYEIIKPGLPTFVHFTDVRETSLVINVSAPKGLQFGIFSDGLVYSIKYYSISTLLDITKVIFVTTESGNAHVLIDNLVPNTNYAFEIRCRLNVKGDKFLWGDPKNITEITHSDVPYLAPVIESSAFDYQIISTNRTISLYWKPVPSQFENGDNFHYIIKYHEYFVPTRIARQTSKKPSPSYFVGNKTSHSFSHLDPGTAYLFKIIAVNDVGKSSNESATIVVDKTEKMLQGPKDITVISYGQGNFDISWKTPDVRYSNFILYWCETYPLATDVKCGRRPLQWIPIVNKTFHKLLLSNQDPIYQFAVATIHDQQTSGMYWAPCTAVFGIPYKVKKMELVPKSSTSLRVRWDMSCEAEKKVVREYAIHYCAYTGNCTYQKIINCTVDGKGHIQWPHVIVSNTTSTEYILSSLKPFTCYGAYIRVRTDGGWGGNSDYAYESTMPAAPGDPPTKVHAVVEDSSIKVSFDPPTIPNGRITRYIIYYNKTSADESSYHKEIRIPEDESGIVHKDVTLENVYYYTNYSIEVMACVDQACSVSSDPVYVNTDISYPGILAIPRVEMLENHINISWDSPVLPNGPLELFQVKLEGDAWNGNTTYNVTGHNFLVLDKQCEVASLNETSIRVRGVNFKKGVPLFGDYSGPTKTIICPKEGLSAGFLAGIVVGTLLAVSFVCFIIYSAVKYVMRNYQAVKNINIQLPKGLESPLDNPLNSYDKFKSGLKNHHDSGIPNDRVYDRLFSASDINLSESEKRGPSGRNHSGESTVSSKIHPSISSANTTKTHNSMDSGAEVESPLSPDSFSSDSGSINALPGLTRTDLNCLTSKDSGLGKDNGLSDQGGSTATHDQGMATTERSLSTSELSVSGAKDAASASGIPTYSKVGYKSQENINAAGQGYSKLGIEYDQNNQIVNSVIVDTVPLPEKKEAMKKSEDPSSEQYCKYGVNANYASTPNLLQKTLNISSHKTIYKSEPSIHIEDSSRRTDEMASSDSDARYHENCVNVDPNKDLSDRSDTAKDDTESYDDYLGIPENLPDFSGLMKNKEIAQLLTQYSEQQNKPEENQEIFALENMSDQDLTSTKTRFLAGGGIVPYDSGFEQPTDQTALPQTSDSYEPIDCDSENEKEEPKKPILIGYIGVTPLVNVSVEGL